MHFQTFFLIFSLTFLLNTIYLNADDGFQRKKTHLKKDPRDYTDRDIDSLYDEWEVKIERLNISFRVSFIFIEFDLG